MFGIQNLSFLNQDMKMELLRIFQVLVELTFFPISMFKVMLGIIDFLLHMMQKDSFNYLEERKHLSMNSTSFSPKVELGQHSGSQILIIGQETSMTFSLFGSFNLQTVLT